MKMPRKPNPRAEYRLREVERVNNSPSLAEKFPAIKSMTLVLTFFDRDGLTQTGEMKYTVNVEHAKSVFSFPCQNGECVGGDFDLSQAVAAAVTERRKNAEGEIRCEGLRTKPNVGQTRCHNILRYKLTLKYV